MVAALDIWLSADDKARIADSGASDDRTQVAKILAEKTGARKPLSFSFAKKKRQEIEVRFAPPGRVNIVFGTAK